MDANIHEKHIPQGVEHNPLNDGVKIEHKKDESLLALAREYGWYLNGVIEKNPYISKADLIGVINVPKFPTTSDTAIAEREHLEQSLKFQDYAHNIHTVTPDMLKTYFKISPERFEKMFGENDIGKQILALLQESGNLQEVANTLNAEGYKTKEGNREITENNLWQALNEANPVSQDVNPKTLQ